MPAGEQRICLLTGAGGTLGAALCQRLAGRWGIAAVHGRRAPPAHPDVFPIEADLTEPGEAARIAQTALARFGRVDALVNNAVRYVLAPALDQRLLDSLEEQFDVNVFAPLRLTAAVAQAAWAGRTGENGARRRCVINVSSLSGSHVYKGGQSAYAASKAALDMLTLHLAKELEPMGVRANGVAPNGFPRIVPTERVAAAVERLAESDDTGRILAVDREGDRWL